MLGSKLYLKIRFRRHTLSPLFPFQLHQEAVQRLAASRQEPSQPDRPGGDSRLLPPAPVGLVPEPRVRSQLPPALPRGRGPALADRFFTAEATEKPIMNGRSVKIK